MTQRPLCTDNVPASDCRAISSSLQKSGTEEAHIFSINILPPHPKRTPILGPKKEVYVPHWWERTQKGAPINFGGLGGQKGGPKRAMLGYKEFSLCFFLPLTRGWMQKWCDTTIPVQQCRETMCWQPDANTIIATPLKPA